MNQTIKDMLQKTAGAIPSQWDIYLDPLLFTLRETPQASTGLAPFELVFGRILHGVLQTLQEGLATAEPQPGQGPASYMIQLRECRNWAHTQAQRHLQEAQAIQKRLYDRTT